MNHRVYKKGIGNLPDPYTRSNISGCFASSHSRHFSVVPPNSQYCKWPSISRASTKGTSEESSKITLKLKLNKSLHKGCALIPPEAASILCIIVNLCLPFPSHLRMKYLRH